MQSEIEESSYRYQREVEREERVIVGVNRYASGEADDPDMELHAVDETIRERQTERLSELRESRDNRAVEKALANLERAAENSENRHAARGLRRVQALLIVGAGFEPARWHAGISKGSSRGVTTLC